MRILHEIDSRIGNRAGEAVKPEFEQVIPSIRKNRFWRLQISDMFGGDHAFGYSVQRHSTGKPIVDRIFPTPEVKSRTASVAPRLVEFQGGQSGFKGIKNGNR